MLGLVCRTRAKLRSPGCSSRGVTWHTPVVVPLLAHSVPRWPPTRCVSTTKPTPRPSHRAPPTPAALTEFVFESAAASVRQALSANSRRHASHRITHIATAPPPYPAGPAPPSPPILAAGGGGTTRSSAGGLPRNAAAATARANDGERTRNNAHLRLLIASFRLCRVLRDVHAAALCAASGEKVTEQLSQFLTVGDNFWDPTVWPMNSHNATRLLSEISYKLSQDCAGVSDNGQLRTSQESVGTLQDLVTLFVDTTLFILHQRQLAIRRGGVDEPFGSSVGVGTESSVRGSSSIETTTTETATDGAMYTNSNAVAAPPRVPLAVSSGLRVLEQVGDRLVALLGSTAELHLDSRALTALIRSLRLVDVHHPALLDCLIQQLAADATTLTQPQLYAVVVDSHLSSLQHARTETGQRREDIYTAGSHFRVPQHPNFVQRNGNVSDRVAPTSLAHSSHHTHETNFGSGASLPDSMPDLFDSLPDLTATGFASVPFNTLERRLRNLSVLVQQLVHAPSLHSALLPLMLHAHYCNLQAGTTTSDATTGVDGSASPSATTSLTAASRWVFECIEGEGFDLSAVQTELPLAPSCILQELVEVCLRGLTDGAHTLSPIGNGLKERYARLLSLACHHLHPRIERVTCENDCSDGSDTTSRDVSRAFSDIPPVELAAGDYTRFTKLRAVAQALKKDRLLWWQPTETATGSSRSTGSTTGASSSAADSRSLSLGVAAALTATTPDGTCLGSSQQHNFLAACLMQSSDAEQLNSLLQVYLHPLCLVAQHVSSQGQVLGQGNPSLHASFSDQRYQLHYPAFQSLIESCTRAVTAMRDLPVYDSGTCTAKPPTFMPGVGANKSVLVTAAVAALSLTDTLGDTLVAHALLGNTTTEQELGAMAAYVSSGVPHRGLFAAVARRIACKGSARGLSELSPNQLIAFIHNLVLTWTFDQDALAIVVKHLSVGHGLTGDNSGSKDNTTQRPDTLYAPADHKGFKRIVSQVFRVFDAPHLELAVTPESHWARETHPLPPLFHMPGLHLDMHVDIDVDGRQQTSTLSASQLRAVAYSVANFTSYTRLADIYRRVLPLFPDPASSHLESVEPAGGTAFLASDPSLSLHVCSSFDVIDFAASLKVGMDYILASAADAVAGRARYAHKLDQASVSSNLAQAWTHLSQWATRDDVSHVNPSSTPCTGTQFRNGASRAAIDETALSLFESLVGDKLAHKLAFTPQQLPSTAVTWHGTAGNIMLPLAIPLTKIAWELHVPSSNVPLSAQVQRSLGISYMPSLQTMWRHAVLTREGWSVHNASTDDFQWQWDTRARRFIVKRDIRALLDSMAAVVVDHA